MRGEGEGGSGGVGMGQWENEKNVVLIVVDEDKIAKVHHTFDIKVQHHIATAPTTPIHSND